MACVDMENISMAMSGVVVLGRWEMGSNQGTVDGLGRHLYILGRWKCWLEKHKHALGRTELGWGCIEGSSVAVV